MIDRIKSIRLFNRRGLELKRKPAFYLLLAVITTASFSLMGICTTGFAITRAAAYPHLTVVSAASYSDTALALDSMAAAFGDKLSTTTMIATDVDTNTPGIQLPTSLGGTTVRVDGIPAPLLFVSQRQINFIIPSAIKSADSYGRSVILELLSDGKEVTRQVIGVYKTAPAIFTHDSSGRGFPAATLVRVKANGDQLFESIMQKDGETGSFSMRPIDLSDETERVFISLFLSGISHAADPNNDGNLNESIRVEINGFEFTPSFAGRQPDFPGLNQINLELPRQLIGNPALALRVISSDTGLNYNPGVFNFTQTGGIASNPTEIYLKAQVTGSATWRSSGLNGLDVHALLSTDSYTFAATSEGIYNSLDDGESWSKAAHAIPLMYKDIPRMYSLLRIPGFYYYSYMAGSNGIGTFVSGFIPYAGGPIVPGSGVDWGYEPIYQIYPETLSSPPKNALSLTLSPSAKYVLAGTDGEGIMRRESQKKNGFDALIWSSVNTGITNMRVPALATCNGRIFAGTMGNGIAVSTNEGESWAAVGGGLPSDLHVFALSVSDHSIFAGTNRGIWRSIDDGKNWSQMNQGLPADIQVNAVLARGENVFVGAIGSGVFLSNDAGRSWRAFNDGLSNKDVLSLSINNAYLYAGVKGGGVFVTPLFSDSNQPPTADSHEITVDEGATTSITLTGSDSDGDPLTYSIVRDPIFKTVYLLSGTPPNLQFTASQSEKDGSFAFRTFDGKSRSKIATVTIKIKPRPTPSLAPPVEPSTFNYNIDGSMTSAIVKWLRRPQESSISALPRPIPVEKR